MAPGSPVELIMIQQQKHGKNIVSTIKNVFAHHGAGWDGIYRGILGLGLLSADSTVGLSSMLPFTRGMPCSS